MRRRQWRLPGDAHRDAPAPLARFLVIAGTLLAVTGLATAGVHSWLGRRPDTAVERGVAVPGVLVDRTEAAAPLEQPLTSGESLVTDPAPSQPAGATAPTTTGTSKAGVATASGREEAVVALTNAERLAAGCSRLVWDDRLALAAQRHAGDMARRNYFEHVSPSGQGPVDRAREAGFAGDVGENLAAGYATAQDVVEAWMGSPGHRANIVQCRFTLIGVSSLDQVIPSKAARGVWVQEFGTAAAG